MLEITETSLITQMAEVRAYLDLLRTLNYRIAMDDSAPAIRRCVIWSTCG